MAKFVTFKPVESEKLNKSEPVLKYKLLSSKAYPPTRETAGSIGYDLRSPRFARIPPRGGTYYLPLGIAFQIPEGHCGRLAPKSGLAIYRSIGVLAGVIDQDYTGEIFVLLINHDDKLSYQIRPEDKVVQLILEKATIARLQEVDTLDDTERSPGGARSLKEQSTAYNKKVLESLNVYLEEDREKQYGSLQSRMTI